MRSKLLRALAHLKAAKAHIAQARAVLGSGWLWSECKLLDQIDEPFKQATRELSQRYADAMVANLEPAKMPK